MIGRHRDAPYDPLTQTGSVQLASQRGDTSCKEDGHFQPLWTRRYVLLCFLLAFAAMLVTLEILFRLSAKRQGLAPATMNQHYLWVYGPTAVLSIVLALWYRVDYRIRQLTPWKSSPYGQIAAGDHNLFKDYLSPTMPEIWWHSLQNHDYPVTVSVLALNLITVLIVVSTSLFILQPEPMYRDEQSYQITSSFLTDIIAPATLSLPMDILDAVDTMNLSYPFGTTPDFAYESFEPIANSSTGDFQRATVNVFTVDLDCQEASLAVSNWTYRWDSCYNGYLEAPSDSKNVQMKIPNCTIDPWLAYPYFNDGHIGNFAFYDFDGCDETPDGSPWDRVYVGVGEAKQTGTAGPMPEVGNCSDERPYASMEVLRSKQWICQPTVWIRPGNVSLNATDLSFGSLPNVTVNRNSPQVNMSDYLAQNLWQAPFAVEASQSFQADTPSLLQALSIDQDAMRDQIERVLRPAVNATMNDLLTTDLFLTLARNHYTRLMVQVVHAGMMDSADRKIQGITITNENRLVLRRFAVRVMQGCLGALILLMGFLLFTFPGSTSLPHDPSRLAGLSLQLRRQPQILSLFSHTGHVGLEDLRHVIKAKVLGIDSTVRPAVFGQDHHNPLIGPYRPHVHWWRPLPVKRSSRSGVSIFVVCIIVTLQVLLFLSDKWRGLVTVSLSGDQHLGWSLVPATIMVAISMYFRALASTYKIFGPYFQLRVSRKGSSGMPLFTNYLTSTEPEVLITSTLNRQWAVTAISLASIFSSFLTIVVSGIWTPNPVPSSQAVKVVTKSMFNTSSDDDGTASNNAFIAGLVLGANLSYPRWTYEDLALTSVEVDFDVARLTAGEEQTFIDLDLPAIRSSLNCTIYTESQIPDLVFYPTFSGYGTHGDPNPHGMFMKMPPKSCAGNSSVTFSPPMDSNNGDWSVFFNNTLPGCPPWNYFFGRQDPATSQSYAGYNATYARALSCYEIVEQVTVATRLGLPSLDIDTSQPPRVIPNIPSTIFSTSIIPYPYAALPQLSRSNLSESGFWAMVYHKYGISTDDYGDPEKLDEVVSAIKSAHGIIRAQQYSAALRNGVDDSNAQSLSATLMSPQRYRLIQNAITTHVLCAILATMLVCAAIASYFMSISHILPKNPCSVAAMVSLLADSNIFENEPLMKALEDKIMHRRSSGEDVLEHTRFQMGWFEGKAEHPWIFALRAIDHEGSRTTWQNEHEASSSSQSLISPIDVGRSFASTVALGQGDLINRR